jgi:hypothetical protein
MRSVQMHKTFHFKDSFGGFEMRQFSRMLATLFFYIASTCFASTALAASVYSRDIIAADNTTGQTLTTGSGVKTGHIQNSAVTTLKIANGAVTGTKLAPGSVASAHIADGAIGSAALANGSVTDAKIAGPISGSKISSAGLNADSVDGKHASELAAALHTHSLSDVQGLTDALSGKADINHSHDNISVLKPAKVIVVAQSGGDYQDLVSALASITDASEANPYLIKIMPGVYALGGYGLTLKEFVDIEGSGRGTTIITAQGVPGATDYGCIEGRPNVELRHLTIKCEGNDTAVAIGLHGPYSPAVGPFRITDVTIIASGAVTNCGIVAAPSFFETLILENVGIVVSNANSGTGIAANYYAKTIMHNVTVDVSGNGTPYYLVGIAGGSTFEADELIVTIHDPSSAGSNGIFAAGGTFSNTEVYSPQYGFGGAWDFVKFYNGKINGGVAAIANANGNQISKFASSQIEGPVTGGNLVKLVNCFDGDFNPINNQ